MAKYQPGTHYSWQATDEFKITGKELEALQTGLAMIEPMIANDNVKLTAKDFLTLVEMYKMIHAKFVSYVEADLIKPQEEPQA